MVTGYPGAADVDVAVEKNEIHCRGTTISAFFGREPGKTWAKNGFVRFLVQTGDKRNHRIPETPTIWELMDQEKGAWIAQKTFGPRRARSRRVWPADFSDAWNSTGSR